MLWEVRNNTAVHSPANVAHYKFHHIIQRQDIPFHKKILNQQQQNHTSHAANTLIQ